MEADLAKRCDAKALALASKVEGQSVIQALQTEVDEFLKAVLDERTEIKNGRKRIVKENIVDSKNVGKKVKKCIKWISSDKIKPPVKIKLSDFVCNKLADYYQLAQEKRDIIVNSLTNIVYEGKDIAIPLRLWYLKFRNEHVPYNTSIALFEKKVQSEMDEMPYFQILKYL